MVKTLKTSKTSPLWTAIQLNDLEVVKCFIERRPENVDMIVTEKGSTLLHVSAQSGSEEICHFLLENGANANACNNLGFTPLHLLNNNDMTEIARMLIQNRANVNATVGQGWTALHCAALDNLTEIVELLINMTENLSV